MELVKPFWDIDETKDYIIVNSLYYKTNYNIIAHYKNKKQAVIILSSIDQFIRTLANTLRKNMDKVPKKLRDGFKVFLSIHPNNHEIFELPVDSMFDGLNKPKGVKKNSTLPKVGKDGELKASKRYLFFKIRNPNGTFRNMEDIVELVIHEIAHTAANHVLWRDDDHKSDYYAYYDYLMDL